MTMTQPVRPTTWSTHARLAAAIASLAMGMAACSAVPCPEPQPAYQAVRPPLPESVLRGCEAPEECEAPQPPELSYSKKLAGVDHIDDALAKVRDALKAHGFGVITEIDVQATMKKKLDMDMRPYWILGACNPAKAHQAIEADPQMGLLLPCKVIVYQDADGDFVVAFARPEAVFTLAADQPGLSSLAKEVDAEIRGAFDAL